MKNILITGGAGFIGANFVDYYVAKYPSRHIINLDLLTYAGKLENLREVSQKENYTFVQGDISDRKQVEDLFHRYDIQGVFNFAAESHVDNSIANPKVFLETNIMGTFTLLDVARNHWMEKPFICKKNYETCRFHHVSTDEVYGTLGDTGLFSETTPYAPNSPYAASKASSDFFVRAYHHTYGLNVTTSNCSNNYGPKQHAEKLIPTIIRKALAKEPIPIYGDGKNVRDWLYVVDHCEGIDVIYEKGKSGETYNIGGNSERDNLAITHQICKILDEKRPWGTNSYKSLITFVEDRAGHDKRYAIDATKLSSELKWTAKKKLEEGLEETIQWYLENE